jgi:V/A-type H+-transporting ATPase subunit A
MPGWVEMVANAKNIIRKGRDASEQINILGDDGVPMSYHEMFWKSELLDFVILQQDAFDAVDALCPLERQKYMLQLILDICKREFEFEDFEKCRDYFKNMINILRQMNYSEFQSEKFNGFIQQLNQLLESNGK